MDQTWWRTPEQLDNDQRAIIALPPSGSHLVLGPPGSGKTNLLLLRAAYMVRNRKPNIAIITFNRLLREFLATGSDHYPFDADRISTFRTWGKNLIHANGGDVDMRGTFPEIRKRIVAGLTDLKARGGKEFQYDCILLDEAQDYEITEIELLRHFSRDFFAVGDNNQRIYQADGAIDHLRTVCTVAPVLRHHYRNGHDICKVADGMMNTSSGGMFDSSNYDEKKYPSFVKRIGKIDLAAQVDHAVKEIKTQLLAYPDEWIGVLCPLNEDAKSAFNLLSASEIGDKVQHQSWNSGYASLDHAKPVIVSTIHAAKGLEYRALHLPAFDTIDRVDNHHRVAYTAITRAKTSLWIYHNGALPGFIERGLVAVEGGPASPPTLNDLFGKS